MSNHLDNLTPGFLTDLTDKRNVYLLGRFWADAHFRLGVAPSIAFECRADDFDSVQRICAQFSATNTRLRQRTREGKLFGKPQAAIHIQLGKRAALFRQMGYDTKMCPRALLGQIPEPLRHYWWRGFFDGDGSLYVARKKDLAFWSTIDQDWTFLQEMIRKLGHESLKITTYRRKGGRHCSSTIGTCKQDIICAFMRYIYQGNDVEEIGLIRKHAKYLSLLEWQRGVLERRGVKRSRYKYVTWQESKQRWRVYIQRLGRIDLGSFKDEEEAYRVLQVYLAKHDKPIEPRAATAAYTSTK